MRSAHALQSFVPLPACRRIRLETPPVFFLCSAVLVCTLASVMRLLMELSRSPNCCRVSICWGMSLWSGGVIVSAFFVVPRLCYEVSGIATFHADEPISARLDSPSFVREYLVQLSIVSTWSVLAVVVTGMAKSYRATGGSLPPIISTHWGQILLVKTVLVTLTVACGARNRWLLATVPNDDSSFLSRITRMLRAESLCMLGVLLLSAWLSNTAPPIE